MGLALNSRLCMLLKNALFPNSTVTIKNLSKPIAPNWSFLQIFRTTKTNSIFTNEPICIPPLVVTQYYSTEAENEYVIRGNSAVMKCKIPSFVSDFVYVESWVSDTAETYTAATTDSGKCTHPPRPIDFSSLMTSLSANNCLFSQCHLVPTN